METEHVTPEHSVISERCLTCVFYYNRFCVLHRYAVFADRKCDKYKPTKKGPAV